MAPDRLSAAAVLRSWRPAATIALPANCILGNADGRSLNAVFIQGVTHDGKNVPAERLGRALAGAMSCFRRGRSGRPPHRLFAVVRAANHRRRQRRGRAMREVEPMAWDFVMNFARDNDLVDRAPTGAATYAASGNKKGSQCEPFSMGLASGGGRQRLDLGRQAALVARGLVLVEQALVGDGVDHRLGGLGRARSALALSPAATAFCTFLMTVRKLRAQRGVGGVELDVLAHALEARSDANGLFLGFGGSGHGESCLDVQQSPRVYRVAAAGRSPGLESRRSPRTSASRPLR